MKPLYQFLGASFVLMTLQAQAVSTYVNPEGEWGKSSRSSLQGILDARGNQAGSGYVSVGSDQVDSSRDAAWQSTGTSSGSIMIEMAGSAGKNSFGIYNAADPTQRLQLFSGKSGGGAQAILDSPYSTFGFYLKTPKGYWYSDASLNDPKKGPADQDHMVAYQGKGGTLALGKSLKHPAGSAAWDTDSYMLAWEDLNLRKSDRDFNDMVVILRNIHPNDPNPEPQAVPDAGSTFGMLGLGLLATGIWFRWSAIRRSAAPA